MFDLFAVFHTECIEHAHQLFGTKQTHQIVFQGDIESGFSRISLTSGTSAELIVNSSGFMPLCADDLQTARCTRFLIQLDIRTTSRHIGSDRHRAVQSGICHDLRFHLMVFRIQDIVLDPLFFQHLTEQFRYLDRDRTDQNRLSGRMCTDHFVHDRTIFLRFCLVDRIVKILSLYRFVRRNLHNVHSVNITELFFFRQSRTCHTALLLKLIEQVLECDRRQRLALPAHLYMLFRLDRLMQTVGITTSRHDSSGKFVDDHYLAVRRHNIILILEHQIVGPERQNDIMLDLQIFRIRKVLDMEELLDFLDAVFGQIDVLFFLVDNVVSRLLDILAHNGVHLRKLSARLAPLQLTRQNVAGFVELC